MATAPQPYTLSKLGERIYALCLGQPMTPEWVAAKLGCTEATVRRIAREHPELFDKSEMILGTY